MTAVPRYFRLEADSPGRVMRFVCGLDGVQLSAPGARRTVTVTRTGRFHDPRYGWFDITREMLLSMVRNFNARTYGQDIFIDVAHKPADGAAAKVLSLSVDGNRLRAEVEFTQFGVDAVQKRGFRYLSAEFVDDFVDNETGQSHGPTLLGAGLTVRPVIKRLDPIELSESGESHGPVFLHPDLVKSLSESLEQITMNWEQKLRAKLQARKLSEAQIEAIITAYKNAAKMLGDDDKAHESLVNDLDAAAKQLSESATPGAPVNITITAPTPKEGEAAKTLSADDVVKLLDERETKKADDARKLAEQKTVRVKQFTDAIDGAKGLSEGTVAELKKAGDLITAEMTPEQVRSLAEMQLSLGNQIEAAKQLGALGFQRAGSPHITLDEGNTIKSLAEDVRKGLLGTGAGASGRLRLPEESKLDPFVKIVLAEFDRQNAPQLQAEAKLLAGGTVNIADTSLPVSYQRQVITELYQDLKILQLVNTSVDITASATHSIPYETRQVGGVYGDAITAEGQPIQQAGIKQEMTLAYINAMKLGLELTNEAIWFTRNNPAINWDAWGRNIASNTQLMRELVARRIANRMLRDADSYGAVTVAAGTAVTAYSGATNAYKTANYPVIRPYQARDLQGQTIGAVENPVTIRDGATPLAEFDGSGTQAAGKYFRWLSYNLGLFQIVDQTGAPTAPAGTITAGYDYSSNVVKVDTDTESGSTYEKQMNKIIQKIGERKAVLSGDRFVAADFLLLSPTLHNMVTDAEQFTAAAARADASISALGDLQPVKGIPATSTNAPNIDLGDERILVGQRGNFFYTIAKVFQIGEPVERVDGNGKFLGKKGAYGEEYNSMLVPKPLRSRYTSVLAYSYTTARGT